MSETKGLFEEFEEVMSHVNGHVGKTTCAPCKVTEVEKRKAHSTSYTKPISKEAYLKSAAEAWFSIKHPGKDATVAVTPDGKVFVGAENVGTYWLTEAELVRKQVEVQSQILETISTILFTEVPNNVQTHKWYKALQHLVADAMTFPDLPKDK